MLGPFEDGQFHEVGMGTVHRHRLPCRLIQAGQASTVALAEVEREDLRKVNTPGVASLIPARSHTFLEIDHKIILTVILLPSAESFKKGCCQLQKYVHKVLVNCLFKLAQEKVWLVVLTVPP